MREDLQTQLFEKYPKIFRQKDLPMTQTCMCWGIDTPDSWYDVLDELCNKIQECVEKNNIPQIEATQVKEKFGYLRFYISGVDESQFEYINNLIGEAEEKTSQVCANCGSREEIKSTTKGWILYLCKDCMLKSKRS